MGRFIFTRLQKKGFDYSLYVPATGRIGPLLNAISDDKLLPGQRYSILCAVGGRVIVGTREYLPIKDGEGGKEGRLIKNFTGFELSGSDVIPSFNEFCGKFDAITQEALAIHEALEQDTRAGGNFTKSQIRFSASRPGHGNDWDKSIAVVTNAARENSQALFVFDDTGNIVDCNHTIRPSQREPVQQAPVAAPPRPPKRAARPSGDDLAVKFVEEAQTATPVVDYMPRKKPMYRLLWDKVAFWQREDNDISSAPTNDM